MTTLLCALALGVSPGVAQDAAKPGPQGPAFSSKLKTLVVFKEGFGFYVREGTATLEDGWATTNLVPQAMGGTFWVYPKNAADRIDTIVLTSDNRVEFEKPETLRTELANKVGLNLRIQTEGRQVVGKLLNLLEKMMLVQDAQKNYVAIEYAKIDGVSLVDFPVRIRMRTTKPNAPTDLGIAYIQEGVQWQPTYLLELNGKSARLTLRGTLLNLNERLDNANVVFVVGAPFLVNRGSIDQLLQGFQSGQWIAESAQNGTSVRFATADAAAKSVAPPAGLFRGSGGLGGGGLGGAPAPVTTDETGELQYYTKPEFSLRPGERAMATIFEIEIPISALFEWNADADDLQYILTLDNKSPQPFTTGSVFVVENQRPVGQQNIQYTAPGGKTELRLAKGIGVKTEKSESEVKRGEVFKVGLENYLPITLKGVMTLENFRKEPAEVRILKNLTGKTVDLGPNSTVKNVAVARQGPNTVTSVEWKVTVPAGKKIEVVYTYETYSSLGR